MAESNSVSEDSVACRFFLSGACRDGERCLFSHDSTRRIPDTVCRYYLQGQCGFGPNCWYDHVLLNKDSAQRTYSSSETQSTVNSLAHCSNYDVAYNFAMNDMNKKNFNQLRFTNCSPDFPENRDVIVKTHASASTSSSNSTSKDWINAPEFMPTHIRSYADIVKDNSVINNKLERPLSDKICPYFSFGNCPFKYCQLIHGEMCELCHKAYLHPFDENARKLHIEKCEKELEEEMEFSFAIQRSLDKTCGICMEVILEKESLSERRFGILEKCNHVFCLSCIRKWRRSRKHESRDSVHFDQLVTRACPECRIASDFVIPNNYFVDSAEEKQRLITEYKKALSKKHCKYFKHGKGTCSFGGACFYLHAKPDGTKVDLPLPVNRRRQNQDGEIDNMENFSLWNYIMNRDENGNIAELTDEMMMFEIMSLIDESDSSDIESVDEDLP